MLLWRLGESEKVQENMKEVVNKDVNDLHLKPSDAVHQVIMVSRHYGNAHVQSQWERANFDPNDIKIPEIFQI